jgi:hypothetical protein
VTITKNNPSRTDTYTGANALRVGWVDAENTGTPSGATQVWLWGGATGTTGGSLSGIYFDNITIVPEPTALGAVALSGLMLLRRRRA